MIKKIKSILLNEYVFSVFTKIVSILLGMIQSILIARYLGAELKGVNAYISSIVSVGSIVITFGMHQAYPYFRQKYGKDKIYNEYLSLVSLLFSAYLILGIFLVVVFPSSLQLKAIIILIPILGYSNIVAYITLIEKPNARNGYWTLVSVLDILYVALLWIFVKRNFFWSVSILLFSDLVKSVIYTCVLRFKIRFNKTQIKLFFDLIRFGLFPMIALLMTMLNYRIDIIMLHHYSSITDAMVGVYSIGLSLSDKIFLIPDTLKGVLVSKLAKGADEHEVAKVSRMGMWIAVVISFIMFIIGKPFIRIFYGKEYIDAFWIIVVTAIGTISIVYFKMIGQYNIINRKQKLNVIMLSVAIVVDVVFNLILIPVWGIIGAAIATTIGNISCCVVFLFYFCKTTNITLGEMILPQKSDIKVFKKMISKNDR